MIFTDESSNFHPYECDGPGKCIHCDRLVSATHEPATCALCQPEGITVTDQAAPSASRKYVVLERSDQELWAIVGNVEAASVEQALKAQAAVSPEWQGGTLVAIPARSWVPKTVKVETQKTVTLA